MRLIDADKLKDYFMKCLKTTEGKDDTKERYAYMAWLRGVHAIDNAPTVDAVEVVRCKDCKFSTKAYPLICKKGKALAVIGAETYCSYGERSEE